MTCACNESTVLVVEDACVGCLKERDKEREREREREPELSKTNTTRIEHMEPSDVDSYALPLRHKAYLFKTMCYVVVENRTCGSVERDHRGL